MNKRRIFGMVRHGCMMVRRNLRSYLLLSVTVVLSLSLLLGYLLYTDSSLYNKYKVLFSYRREDVVIQDNIEKVEQADSFCINASEIGETYTYIAYTGIAEQLKATYGADGMDQNISFVNWLLVYYPENAWVSQVMTENLPTGEIVWLDGRNDQTITLDTYEAVINEGLYYALGFDQQENPVYTFRFENDVALTLQIVGYAKDKIPFYLDWFAETEGEYYRNELILSTKLLDAEELWDTGNMVSDYEIVTYSNEPEKINQLAEQMNYTIVTSTYEWQNSALEAIRLEKRNKSIIACAMLLLLGINLYSSFTNALNDRKFEIGVKRAIGASSWSIVRQFLYESLLVMAGNILLSIALVTDIFIVYKYIYQHIPNEWGQYLQFVLYISPHSVAMFAVCSISLTIVFSLIFAYKSTRVEIVQYLKAE